MNGRVYDYNMGRFMSVDPFIQSPTSTQSVNPYSYIMNNPLSGTDPTGYYAKITGSHLKDKPNSGNSSGVAGISTSDLKSVKVSKNNNGSTTVNVTLKDNSVVSQNFDSSGIGGLTSISKQGNGTNVNQIYSDTASTIANGAAAAVGNLIPDMANGIADWTERFFHQDSGSLGRMDQWADVDNEVAQGVANDFRKIIAVGTAMIPVMRVSTSTSLTAQLTQQGVKHNPANIVQIGKNADGKIMFLETGNSSAGLQHIVQRHGADFANRGISQSQIPQAIMAAVTRGKVVGYQGKGTGRPIYEVGFGGQTHRIAVTTGSNGFIVGANPAR